MLICFRICYREGVINSYTFPAVFFLWSFIVAASCADHVDYVRLHEIGEDQPIACYIRVVDQDQKPIGNTRFTCSIWSRDAVGRAYGKRDLESVTSSPQGDISIVGQRGGYLGLSVDDDRYSHGIFPPGIGTGPMLIFKYSSNGPMTPPEHGVPGNPTIIHLWRKEGPQPLIDLSGDLRIPYTGDPVRIDLLTGTVVGQGGDLLVEAEMPKTDEDRRKAADTRGIFPAHFIVTFLGGGMIDLKGDAAEQAKYAAGITAGDFPETKLTGQLIRVTGFFRLREGHLHGRMDLTVGAEPVGKTDQGRIVIRIGNALLNPTGSRSLEPDPFHTTKVRLSAPHASGDVPSRP
jgi:hypothetical protein